MTESELGKMYKNGEIICEEGAAGDTMYVIQSGKIAITKRSSEGEIAIATLDSGEIFGEMSLFDKLPRSATAKASGDARVLTIDKKKLFATISRDPTLVFKILESMSKRIRRLDDELAKLRARKSDLNRLTMSVEETCRLILDEAKKVIKSDNGSVMLVEEDGRTLAVKAAFGAKADTVMKFTPGKGIAGDVMKTGKAELINNVTLDARFVEGAAKIHSMLCVPIRQKDEVLGVINMSNTSDKMFTIDDLNLLHSLALYSAVAINNARSFLSLKQTADDLLRHATMLDM